MIEYKYQKVKGLSEKKFLENGHTMFETDVLQRLKRLAHLEEQIKQGQLLPIDSVSKRFEIDFDGNVLAGIEITNNEPKVFGAMNGWGNGISLDKCKITEKMD